MKLSLLKDGAVIGAALFSMFFGAGNMIFPPYLGMQAGVEWITGFLCYFIFDIGLAIVVIAAMVKHGDFENILSLTGRYFSRIIMLAVILCLGPFICIPRTAATTFELSVLSLFPNASAPLCYIGFFALVFFMCKNESGIVDLVGKLLTPMLFAGLIYLIAVGVVNPIGAISETIKTRSVAYSGVQAGYQSLDALAAAVFGTLVIKSARHKGYKDNKKQLYSVIAIACIVAGTGLLVIYAGLTYLGATVSEIFDNHTLRSELLIGIVDRLIPGRVGVLLFSLIAGLACLSTAVAITGSCAGYFSKITKGKISYTAFLAIICIFSTAVSFVGVDKLVTLASPVLNVLYPPVMIIVFISFFIKRNRM